MPVINLEFDDNKISDPDVKKVSQVIQKIVSEVTNIEDVFVYANSAHIKIKVAPIEIFVRMSAHKIANADQLLADIKARLITWKAEAGFTYLINLTLVPEQWKIEIGI